MRFAAIPQNHDDINTIEQTSLDDRLTFNTTYQIIKHAGEVYAKKPAMHFLMQGNAHEDPITLTYQDLLLRINRAANVFLNLQKTNGNVVSYLLPNLPQTHFALWGAQAVGIVNPLRPDLSPEQIVAILRSANSKTLVTVGEFVPGPMWQNVLRARELYPDLKTIFVIHGKSDESNGIYDFDQALDKASPHFAQHAVSPNDICAYFHTSATTTPNPKLARLTQRGLVYAAWAAGSYCGYQESDTFAVGLPLFHVGAPIIGGLTPFMCGATTVITSPMGWMNQNVINNFWNIAKRYNITITAALNFIYSQLLNIPGIENTSLRLAISGTPLLTHESAAYKKFGIKIAELYGSTETIISSFNSPENPRYSSMGMRLAYQQLKVTKSDGSACAINEVGELWTRGPSVTKGYQLGSQHAFTVDGWFKTGDLVRQDNEGYFWFFDRTADVIKKKSGMISSLALEHLFEKYPKVNRAAVISQPDLQHGEVPVLYVTAKPGCELTAAELQQWSQEHLDPTMRPVEILIEQAFLLNGIAKILKPILRERNVTALYSKILSQLFTEKEVIFDVQTKYNADEKLIAVIHISTAEDQHAKIVDQIQQALSGYSVPIAIKCEEPVMSLKI